MHMDKTGFYSRVMVVQGQEILQCVMMFIVLGVMDVEMNAICYIKIHAMIRAFHWNIEMPTCLVTFIVDKGM